MADPFSTVAELPRDRWGRPLITPPGEDKAQAYKRVTTFVDVLEDKYGLMKWGQRQVAYGMARRPDLQAAAAAVTDPKDYHQKRKLQEIAEEAMDEAGADNAALVGTALHTFTEIIDRGETPTNVPDEYLADLEAYKQITEDFTVVAMEGFCVNDELRIGGSYDRIMRLPEEGLVAPDGTLVTGNVVWDLKTGGSIEGGLLGMGKIAMQIGCYANSQDYDHAIGSRTPLDVNLKWGIICHLPQGSGAAQLIWIDIEAGFEAAKELASRVHAWRSRKDLSKTFRSVTVDTAPPSLLDKIANAENLEALVGLYRDNKDIWTPGLNERAKVRRAELGAT